MDNKSTNRINIGGKLETALSGDYPLKVGAVVNEAWQMTFRHFFRFSPAIVFFMCLQLAIFVIALKMQIGDLTLLLDAILNPELFDPAYFQAIFIANMSYEVITAPFFASLCMMSISHASGFSTKSTHITKGLAFTVPVILATLASLALQYVTSLLLAFASFYLSIVFSHSVMLICEKRISPMQSLLLSLRASNKKLFVMVALYTLILGLVMTSAMLYGVGLLITLPFYFHVKAILYREMFGITLTVIASKADTPQSTEDNESQTNPQQPPRDAGQSGGSSDTFDA